MSMAHIRKHYGVPAKRGMRIKHSWHTWDGCECIAEGVIVGSMDNWLRVRFDGERRAVTLNPAACVEYLEDLPA